jgi:hypothetical protein
MYTQDRELFARLARLFSRLPPRLSERLAERAGPALTAWVAAEMSSARATEIALRMPTAFTADVVVHLDPRRTSDLIRRMPIDRLLPVIEELVRRDDFMTISRFVEFFPDDTIRAVLDAINDDEALLRIAFFMGSKNRLDHLFRLLPAERMENLVVLVADDTKDLLSELLSLLIHVSYGLKRQLVDIAAAQGEGVLTRYVRGAHEQGLWADMLPVVATMSEDSQRMVVNLPVLREPAVQEGIIRAADEHGLWGLVLALVRGMDDENREAVAGIVAGRSRATLENAAGAALMGELWEPLLDLVRRMPPPRQEDFAAIVLAYGEVDAGLLRRIAGRAETLGFGERFSAAR